MGLLFGMTLLASSTICQDFINCGKALKMMTCSVAYDEFPDQIHSPHSKLFIDTNWKNSSVIYAVSFNELHQSNVMALLLKC